ncbi:MAG: hypothetical protein LBU79_06005 [Planctomycetota bacterium]|jgi:hypothetical protein|nr:hypothetical protein [Planctomycetota bacterium]
MAINVNQSNAVPGGFVARNPRGRTSSLENLSSGFRIDSSSNATPAASRNARSRANLVEAAARNAAQSDDIQRVSQNSYNARNAELVQRSASRSQSGSEFVGGASGQVDAYA